MSRFFLLLCGLLSATLLAAQSTDSKPSVPSSKSSPCPTNTFFKIFGTPTEKEWATSIVPSGDGNFYLAGRRGEKTLLAKMTPAGESIWTRLLNIGIPATNTTAIIVDSEGMIVGAGQKNDNTPINALAFRYDPALNKTLWIKTFDSERPITGGILEKSPGGNFILYQDPRPINDLTKAEVLELDRTTGNLVPGWQKRYADTRQQTFNAAIIYKDAFYATGYRNVNSGGWGGRMLLTKLDTANGEVLWSKTGHLDAVQNGHLEGNDIIVDQDSLVVLYTGQITDGGPLYTFLQKTDLDGHVAWTRRYGLNLKGKEVLAVPDGYIVFTQRTTSPWVLYKTDKNGNILATKTMTYKPSGIVTNSSYEQNQMVLLDDHLFFVNFGYDNGEEIRLLKTDLNLELEDTCTYYKTANIESVLLVPNPTNYPVDQIVTASPVTQAGYTGFLSTDFIPEKSVCACPGGACENKPDLAISFVGLRCSQGQIFGQFEICNVGESKFSGPITVGLFDANPASPAAQYLASNGYLNGEIEVDSCKLIEMPNLNLLGLPHYHVLIDIRPAILAYPPFLIDTLTPYNGIVECSYGNNLDSFEVILHPQKPDLGPDRGICLGQNIFLDAGSGYALYNWSNGTSNQTLTVTEPGIYTVEVTDQCGQTIRDTVQIAVLPFVFLTGTLTLLPGDTLTIGGVAYTEAGMATDTLLSSSASCDTIVTYTILLDSLHCSQAKSFLKRYDRPGEHAQGGVLVAAADGSFYIGGDIDSQPFIMKTSADGTMLWSRRLQFLTGNINQEMSALIEDSEGMLVGCGSQGGSDFSKQSYAFRYNPATNQLLWLKQIVSNLEVKAYGILEEAPGGNYVLYSRFRSSNGVYDGETGLLERNTGNLITGKMTSYRLQGSSYFKSMVVHDGALYGVGEFALTTGVGKTRQGLAKIDLLSGNPLWATSSHVDTSTFAELTGYDLLFDGDTLVSLFYGKETPEDSQSIYLQKTTSYGELVWVQRYGGLGDAAPIALTAVPAGYVYCANIGDQLLIVKTDRNGQVDWARTLAQAASYNLNDRGTQTLAVRGDNLYFVSSSFPAFGAPTQVLLGKLDAQGNLQEGCAGLTATTVQGNKIVHPSSRALDLLALKVTRELQTPNLPSTGSALPFLSKTVCSDCETSCQNVPDLVASFVGLECNSGEVLGRFELCNIGKDTFSGPYNITIYDANPLTDSAGHSLGAFFPAIVLAPDSCRFFDVYLQSLVASGQSGLWYSIIQTSSTITPTPPIPLDSFPYVGLPAECDYINNVDSFELNPLPVQKPDLGPDRLICPGRSTTLEAGSGYLYYNWLVDNVFTQTLTVSETGEYIVEVTDQCGQKARDTIQVMILPYPTRSETVLLLPGDSITIDGMVYTGAAVVVDTVPALTTASCDTLVTYTLLTCTDTNITKNIPFYPGDTIVIDGTAYTQSDTVVQLFTSVTGCDSVVTNILQLIVTSINVQCPTDVTVTLPPNSPTTVVDYDLPTATTDCPDPALTFTLLQGLPVGGQFAEGSTQVCYQIANQCGIRDTCCFYVTVLPAEMPCDAKSLGCISYELLDIHFDSLGQRRYRVGVQNNCITPIQYIYIQLPNGVSAVSPAEGATYTAPGGNTYLTRNPNASPFYSLRFKPVMGILNSSNEDIFEYTLPQQADPSYIHVGVRINDGSYSEVLLNTFNCPVQPYAATRPAPYGIQSRTLTNPALAVRPNPTNGQLFVQLQPWLGQQVQIRILNAQGQLVLDRSYTADREELGLDLPGGLANGLYYLSVQPLGGARTATRFILER